MFKKLISKILQHDKVAVFSHLSPDGDCLGAQTALCLWLQKNGLEVSAYNEDSIPDDMAWLDSFFPVSSPEDADLTLYDAYIFVDGNALHRFGEEAVSLLDSGKPLYMIDHHPEPQDVFEESVLVQDASSACELIYKLYSEHDITQIDEKSAKAMYLGMVTDTGSFQFESVSPDTLKAAGELLERGNFKPNEITERIYSNRPLKQLKLLSLALNTVSLHSDDQLATIFITKDMLAKTNTTKQDTEGFVQYPLSIKGVKACVLLREDNDRIKLSLRSKSDVDVNKWAKELNGGGHKKAAGGWHPGPLEKAIAESVKIGSKQL